MRNKGQKMWRKRWKKLYKVMQKNGGKNELLAQLCALAISTNADIAMVWWAYYHTNGNQWIHNNANGRSYVLPGPVFSEPRLALEYAVENLKWTETIEEAPCAGSEWVVGYRHEGDGIVCFQCRYHGGNCGGGAVYSLMYTEDGYRFVYDYDH